MTYYYFTTAEHGLDNIRKRRIKISDIRLVNDPFEFVAADASNKENRIILNKLKNELGKEKGIICFSRNWRNPVQWSHYGDRHRGLCLGFEIPNKYLAQVSYVNSWIPWPEQVDVAFLATLFRTKFSHWSYEDEFRIFCKLTHPENGLHFCNFGKIMKLSKVIVGPSSVVTRADLSQALGELAPSVEVFKARAAFRSFKVVRQKNQSLWR